MRIARAIRDLRPELKLILGGPHVTLAYSALKLERKRGISGGRAQRAVDQLEAAFDVLCSGDGELAIFEALRRRAQARRRRRSQGRPVPERPTVRRAAAAGAPSSTCAPTATASRGHRATSR
jgi:radical SAM superfamily enzyme YgiQ (UPF0313 family)